MELAKERLYFNEGATKLVKEGDPAARVLACAAGDPIPDVQPETKAQQPEGDKGGKPKGNK